MEGASGKLSQSINYKHGRKQMDRHPPPPNINRKKKLSVQLTCRVTAVCSFDCLKKIHLHPSPNHLSPHLKTTTTTTISLIILISSSFSNHRQKLKNHYSYNNRILHRNSLQKAMKTQKTSRIHLLHSMEVDLHRDHRSEEEVSVAS